MTNNCYYINIYTISCTLNIKFLHPTIINAFCNGIFTI